MIRLAKEYNEVLRSFYKGETPKIANWQTYASELTDEGYLIERDTRYDPRHKITIKGVSYLADKRYIDVTYYLSLGISLFSLFISLITLLKELGLIDLLISALS